MTYNEIMTTAGKMLSPRIYYYENDEIVEISRDNLLKIRHYYDAGLVGTVMKGVELELNILVPATSFHIELTASYDEYEQTRNYGEFFLKEEPTYNADSRTYTYQLYDGFMTTMVNYSPVEVDFPCSVYDYFKALVTSLGFTTNIVELTNGNQILASDIYSDINFTYRDVFEDIGKATATLFKIEDKVVSICDFKENEIEINDDILKNSNITFNKGYGPINTIILSRSAGSDSITLSSPESLPDEEKVAYRINDCQMLNDNDRSNFIDAILQKLKGVEFYIYDTELVGYGGFEPLQKIKFVTGDNTYYSYVFSNEETITTGYAETISAEEIESQGQDYSVTSATDKIINETYLIVDKQNQTINGVAKKVDENEERVSEIEITVDGINSKVTDTQTSVNELGEKVTTMQSTLFEQTKDAFTMWFDQTGVAGDLEVLQKTLEDDKEFTEEQKQYIHFEEGGITLGRSDSQVKLFIRNDRISFMTGDTESAYISENTLYITDSTILNKMQVGRWETKEDDEGNLNTKWVGDN